MRKINNTMFYVKCIRTKAKWCAAKNMLKHKLSLGCKYAVNEIIYEDGIKYYVIDELSDRVKFDSRFFEVTSNNNLFWRSYKICKIAFNNE